MPRARRSALSCVVIAAFMALGSAARAAPNVDDPKKAQEAFVRATKEFQAGDYRAAAQHFEYA